MNGERGPTVRYTFRPSVPVGEPEPSAPQPCRAARTLALAHHVDRLVDEGRLADYASAARALGITRARMTQIMKLLLLAPEIQERILCGEVGLSERSLRAAVGEPRWPEQPAPSTTR